MAADNPSTILTHIIQYVLKLTELSRRTIINDQTIFTVFLEDYSAYLIVKWHMKGDPSTFLPVKSYVG
jgi:hypothetical protein